MDLISFARAHGIVIDRLPPLGVWRRYPTEDHMHKRNGAIKYMGDHAFVQNHAIDTEVNVWKSDAEAKPIDYARLARLAKESNDETNRRQAEAAKKAKWIVQQCQNGRHEYLKAKGFDDEPGHVWAFEGKQLLVIPMRVNGNIVGAQLISESGDKKFLTGQRTSHAEYVFDNKGPHYLVEGYATGLAVKTVLKKLQLPYTIHVTFSAGNMVKIAANLPGGFIFADNDASLTGEKTAKAIGWKYWMSDIVGEDAHDAWKRMGLFRMTQSVGKAIRS